MSFLHFLRAALKPVAVVISKLGGVCYLFQSFTFKPMNLKSVPHGTSVIL